MVQHENELEKFDDSPKNEVEMKQILESMDTKAKKPVPRNSLGVQLGLFEALANPIKMAQATARERAGARNSEDALKSELLTESPEVSEALPQDFSRRL